MVCLLATIGCVDNNFRIDEVSTEVTVGAGTTVVPLANLDKTTLAELLEGVDEADLQWLNVDAEGNYSAQFDGEGAYVEVKGINSTINVPAVNTSFYSQYPSMNIQSANFSIDESFAISVLRDGLSVDGLTLPIPAGIVLTGHEDDTLVHHVDYDVPEEVNSIDRIYFGQDERGSQILVQLNFNDLAAVNGGGKVNVELVAPEGYVLCDEEGNVLPNATYKMENVPFDEGDNELHFSVYLQSIELGWHRDNARLDIPVELEYHLSFEMNTKAANLTLTQSPELRVSAELSCRDAQITLANTTIIDTSTSTEEPAEDVTVSNLPPEVKSINAIDFVDNSPLTLYATGYSWLSDNAAEAVVVEARFPDYFSLVDGTYAGYTLEDGVIRTTLKGLRDGISLNFDKLDFGAEGLVVEDGTLGLVFTPEIKVGFVEGSQIMLSELNNNGSDTLFVKACIESLSLGISSVSGIIDYSETYTEEISLAALGELPDLTIEGTGLSPIIGIDLSNPLTMTAIVDASFVPKRGGVAMEENTIEIKGVAIAPAKREGGVTTPGVMRIIIAEEAHRAEFNDPQYTFVACDVNKLLSGELPDALDFSVSLKTDSSQVQTLYVEDVYRVDYDYYVDVPLAFDKSLGISYGQTITDLGSMFEDIASYEGIKIGDVALILKAVNTTPLHLDAAVEFYDKDGNATEAYVNIPNGFVLNGSKDGVTEAKSEIRLEIALPDGDMSRLATIDSIGIEVSATGEAEEHVSLNANQYLQLSAQLELAGGITVDLKELSM